MANTRLVYSTETGSICPKCQKPVSDCTCNMKRKGADPIPQFKPDGIIRIRREVKGRKGKTVTTISGLSLDDKALNLFSKQLKQHCGTTGGSVKDGVIVLQGDHRDAVKGYLEGKGVRLRLLLEGGGDGWYHK